MTMRVILSILAIVAWQYTSAQSVQFIVVCNTESQKLEIVQPQDTLNSSYTVVKRKLPNRTVAQNWINKNHPDGTCNLNTPEKKIKPNIPKSAGQPSATDSNQPPPKKKITHFYRNKFLLIYGSTSFNLDELPGFDQLEDKGKFYGIRFQKGDGFQVGGYINYNYYGSVNSYRVAFGNTSTKEKRWSNVDAGMIFSKPIELVRKSGQFWLLPEVGIGASWQNLGDAMPEDFMLDVLGGGFQYTLKLSLEVYHFNFSLERVRLLQETIEEHPNFKFKGMKFGVGLAF